MGAMPHTIQRAGAAGLRASLRLGLIVVVAAAVAVLATPRWARAYVCPLAPRHGVLCKYVDQRMFQALAKNAEIEGLRWGALHGMESSLKRVDGLVSRGTELIDSYNRTLTDMKTPKTDPVAAFAAAFNTTGTEGEVRLTLVDGSVKMVNIGAASQTALVDVNRSAHGGDFMTQRARGLAALAEQLDPTGAMARAVGGQLATSYMASDSTAAHGLGATVNANAFSERVRQHRGAEGEADATVLGAKGRLDEMRALQNDLRIDNLDRTVGSLQKLQASRAAQLRAIQRMQQLTGGGW